MELADRVVVMSQGRIEQAGTPDEIYDAPNSPFVFSFIGESSVLPVNVKSGEVLLDGVPLAIDPGDTAEGAASLYFRPHEVELVEAGTGAIEGIVESLRRSGRSRFAEIAVPGIGRFEIEIIAESVLNSGDPVSVLPRRWRLYADASRGGADA